MGVGGKCQGHSMLAGANGKRDWSQLWCPAHYIARLRGIFEWGARYKKRGGGSTESWGRSQHFLRSQSLPSRVPASHLLMSSWQANHKGQGMIPTVGAWSVDSLLIASPFKGHPLHGRSPSQVSWGHRGRMPGTFHSKVPLGLLL